MENKFDSKAGEFVRKGVKGNNFLTDEILGYGFINKDMAYELSTGNFMGKKLFGITVCKREDGKYSQAFELGKCCHSEEEVDAHIKYLKEGVGANE